MSTKVGPAPGMSENVKKLAKRQYTVMEGWTVNRANERMKRTGRQFNTNLDSFASAARAEAIFELGVGENLSCKAKGSRKDGRLRFHCIIGMRKMKVTLCWNVSVISSWTIWGLRRWSCGESNKKTMTASQHLSGDHVLGCNRISSSLPTFEGANASSIEFLNHGIRAKLNSFPPHKQNRMTKRFR
jgi:hypothetical protein